MKKSPFRTCLFLDSQRGFSLVEIVIALGIVSFAMMSIVGLIMVGMNVFRSSIDTSVQTRIAQQIINEAQLSDFGKLVDYQAYFDADGAEVSPGDERRKFLVDVSLGRATNSLTQIFATNVARDLVVEIRNRSRPDEVRTFSAVMVKND